MIQKSGWILPDGSFVECEPWLHLQTAKTISFVIEMKNSHIGLQDTWDDTEGELLRKSLGDIGLVKVNNELVDAHYINNTQLKVLQQLYDLAPPEKEIVFVGKISLRLPVRLFLKLKNPDRLNMLADMQ